MAIVKENRRHQPFREFVRESIQDPKLAAEYLNAAAKEEDSGAFMIALKDVIDVYGGLSDLARKANLNRGSLHRALTGKSMAKFETFQKALTAAGFEMTFKPIAKTIRRNTRHGRTESSARKSVRKGA